MFYYPLQNVGIQLMWQPRAGHVPDVWSKRQSDSGETARALRHLGPHLEAGDGAEPIQNFPRSSVLRNPGTGHQANLNDPNLDQGVKSLKFWVGDDRVLNLAVQPLLAAVMSCYSVFLLGVFKDVLLELTLEWVLHCCWVCLSLKNWQGAWQARGTTVSLASENWTNRILCFVVLGFSQLQKIV